MSKDELASTKLDALRVGKWALEIAMMCSVDDPATVNHAQLVARLMVIAKEVTAHAPDWALEAVGLKRIVETTTKESTHDNRTTGSEDGFAE